MISSPCQVLFSDIFIIAFLVTNFQLWPPSPTSNGQDVAMSVHTLEAFYLHAAHSAPVCSKRPAGVSPGSLTAPSCTAAFNHMWLRK